MKSSDSDHSPLEVARYVRPRARTDRARDLNLIVISDTGGFSEHRTDGTDGTDIPTLIRTAPASLVVCTNHARVFRLLDRAFHDDPQWDWQVSVQQKRLRGDARFTVEDVGITLAGWKGKSHKRGRWHHFIDPAHFAPNADWPADLSLYDFGVDVRAFLTQFQLTPCAKAGGIAAQLLRHPDIYEQPRRQVPSFINDQARESMPGNHYQFVDGAPGREYQEVWYLDQEAAHHHAARHIHLPHADHLVAMGRHRADPRADDPAQHNPADRPWLSGERLAAFLEWQPKGLLYARLTLASPTGSLGPTGSPGDPAPRWYHRLLDKGTCLAYIYTNELDLLAQYGVTIDYIVGAWVSTERDECLPFYAEFALFQTRNAEGMRRLWLKPTLHAVYGMLAAKTTELEFVRKRGRGTTRTVDIGGGVVEGVTSGPRTFVPKITNVIQRGMIEAETRKRSCLLARTLKARGHRVLSIYADGVLVESRDQDGLPPMVPSSAGNTWRTKPPMTHLRYQDETHFLSAQVLKWPGTPTQHRPVEIGSEREVRAS